MHSEIYEEMKKINPWTIYEGIMLMVQPQYIHCDAQYRIYADKHLLPFQRAVEGGSLKAIPPEDCVDKFSRSNLIMGWQNHIGRFKISNVLFLEFVKRKQLFEIPPELELLKVTESGQPKYYWKSSFSEEALKKLSEAKRNANTSESSRSDSLTGKERQELGRLRVEKSKMDATVKAAVEVGRFIIKKEMAGEKIKREDIDNFVYSIDKDLPGTRIDQIWKSISESFKKGIGRPSNKTDNT